MNSDDPCRDLVLRFFLAMLDGDAAALAAVALPHRDLLRVLLPAAPAARALRAAVESMTVDWLPLPGQRRLARARFGGETHAVVVHDRDGDPRIDARHWLPETEIERQCREVAREFLSAFWSGDLAAMHRASSDHREIDAVRQLPDMCHVVADDVCVHDARAMLFAALAPGEAFHVGDTVEFVDASYAANGVVVLSGICPSGEVPFLLRRIDGEWRVIPYHFVRNAGDIAERCVRRRAEQTALAAS